MKNTSSRLKEIMKERNLKQVDILEMSKPYQNKLGIKMSKSHLSQYVNGKSSPDQRKLYLLAKTLNVDEGWLMGYDIPKERNILERAEQSLDIIPAEQVPVVSSISAGEPLYSEENIIDYTHVPSTIKKNGKEFFYLKVSGDSMNREFNSGDLVLVERGAHIENGQIGVVALNGDEATVKRIKYDENKIYLIPESDNPTHMPKVFTENDDIRFIGKVVSMTRTF